MTKQFSKWRAHQEVLQVRVITPTDAVALGAAVEEVTRWRDEVYGHPDDTATSHPIRVVLERESIVLSFDGDFEAVGA